MVLFSCVTDIPISRLVTSIMKGIFERFFGCIQFASKEPVEAYVLPTYKAVLKLLIFTVTCALNGSITMDGWSAFLQSPMICMTWNYVYESWRLNNVPICTLNTNNASKSGEKLRYIVEEFLKNSSVIGSNKISIKTINTENEASVGHDADLLTNFVGSVRCVVIALDLFVNDVFEQDELWQKYMNHVNMVTKFTKNHRKAAMMFREVQMQRGVTQDRLNRLKRDIPIRWHSRLGSMLTYITELDNIASIFSELEISSANVPQMTVEQKNNLAEIIYVLGEVQRVARLLEANPKVTM